MDLVEIYQAIRDTGLPNAQKAKCALPTNLNLHVQDKLLTESRDDRELFDFICFGFPLGYLGPSSNTKGVDNHPSATKYPKAIEAFIKRDLSWEELWVPFEEWAHNSPIMT